MLSSLLSATIIEVIGVVAARLGRAPRRVVGQKRLHRCPNGIESFPLLIPKNALLSPRRGLVREARIDRLSVSKFETLQRGYIISSATHVSI